MKDARTILRRLHEQERPFRILFRTVRGELREYVDVRVDAFRKDGVTLALSSGRGYRVARFSNVVEIETEDEVYRSHSVS